MDLQKILLYYRKSLLFQLNVFHWHIVDTHSIPIEFLGELTAPLTQYGAYDAASIYTQQDIKDFVEYANYRGKKICLSSSNDGTEMKFLGVRVIPELDQPAHVGNGWNFPGGENLTVCVNQEPWYDLCVEPPCGQV